MGELIDITERLKQKADDRKIEHEQTKNALFIHQHSDDDTFENLNEFDFAIR